jgi:hypothetical protein
MSMRPLHAKALLLVASCAPIAGCNHLSAKDTGVAASSDTTATATTGPSVVDKIVLGSPFEGSITMTVTGTKGFVLDFEVKGSKARFVQSPPIGDSAYTITDYAEKTVALVSDAKKSVTIMNMDMLSQGGAAKKKLAEEPMDKTGVVLGYACDFHRVTWPNGDKSEGCLAKGIHIPQIAANNAWLGFGGGDSLPMRNVTMDASGKEKSRMEVTKIDRTVPDDSRFVAPAGYKTQTLEDMEKGLHAR